MYLVPGILGTLSAIGLILWRIFDSILFCIFGGVLLVFFIIALIICLVTDMCIEITIYDANGRKVNIEDCLLYNLKDFVKEYTDYSEIAFTTNTGAYIEHYDGWYHETFRLPVAKIYNKDNINESCTYVPVYFGRYRSDYRKYEKILAKIKTKELTDEFKKGLYKKLEVDYLKTKSS